MKLHFIAAVLVFIVLGTTLFAIESVAKSLKPIAEYEIVENIRLSKQILKRMPTNVSASNKLKRDIENLEKHAIPSSRTSAQGGELSPRIVNGVWTSAYPEVGALLYRKESGIFRASCTGTMIACDEFLTAAHCIIDDLDETHYQVYLQNGGIFDVEKIAYPSEEYHFPTADVAVLKLTNPVNGIAPARINNLAKILPKSIGIIVGFGRTGGLRFDPGIKQIGTVNTSICPSQLPEDNLICWKFEGPVGNPGEDSNTCQGDSGGPLYVRLNNKDYVVGITSGGKNKYCLTDDLSYDASVFKYWQFIRDAANLSNTLPTCGSLPTVGTEFRTIVQAGSGELSEENKIARFELFVPPDVAILRIAMNGIDNRANNFDLYVHHGGQSSADKIDYVSSKPGQFEFCEINKPPYGEWNITVQRQAGSGSFQVIATIFGY